MAMARNKITFILFFTVLKANPNGDPLNGNRPRIDFLGNGEVAAPCIARKCRNRFQDMGYEIFIQSDGRETDEFRSLSKRANACFKGLKTTEEKIRAACEKWIDVRMFGQVFAYKDKGNKDEKAEGVSISITTPVTFTEAVTVEPVDVSSMQITKSVNGEECEGKSSDRFGTKHRVDFGLYRVMGNINIQNAEKTGLTEEDVEVLKKALLTLFDNDASTARPEGSMEVRKLLWYDHGCKDGKYNPAKINRSVVVTKKTDGIASDYEDYDIKVMPLEGLVPEIYDL